MKCLCPRSNYKAPSVSLSATRSKPNWSALFPIKIMSLIHQRRESKNRFFISLNGKIEIILWYQNNLPISFFLPSAQSGRVQINYDSQSNYFLPPNSLLPTQQNVFIFIPFYQHRTILEIRGVVCRFCHGWVKVFWIFEGCGDGFAVIRCRNYAVAI